MSTVEILAVIFGVYCAFCSLTLTFFRPRFLFGDTEDTSDEGNQSAKRAGLPWYLVRKIIVYVAVAIVVPAVFIALVFVFRPPVLPDTDIATINEYPEKIAVKGNFTLGGSVDSERVPNDWELWAIEKGPEKYLAAPIGQQDDERWKQKFSTGNSTGSYDFLMVLGLAKKDTAMRLAQWRGNATKCENLYAGTPKVADCWAGIPNKEIELTDSNWVVQDSLWLYYDAELAKTTP